MTATWLPEHNQPLLRPTPNELALAPELGVLAALDATLATAAYQLMAEHPDLGHPPRRARPTTCASISTTSAPPSKTTASLSSTQSQKATT
jgi:hypothetical protein